jgi:integrase/recombinase XerD
MKTKISNLLGPALGDYFADHLPRIRGMSPNTIQSYRDSLVLLLRFVACDRKRTVADLDLNDIDPQRVLAFLSHLERDRKNGVPTRNVRLWAIHALSIARRVHSSTMATFPEITENSVRVWTSNLVAR